MPKPASMPKPALMPADQPSGRSQCLKAIYPAAKTVNSLPFSNLAKYFEGVTPPMIRFVR